MNIFVFNKDIPTLNCKYHCDKHVVKMILEYGQLLSNTKWLSGDKGFCRLTHKNHPATKWVCESLANYIWLAETAWELQKEYTHRYNREHAWKSKLWQAKNYLPKLPNIDKTPHVQCMPDKYKSDNVEQAYIDYFNNEKQHIAKWTNRITPNWYIPQMLSV